MNNKEAFDFLSSRKSVRDATIVFMDSQQLDDKYYSCIRYKFVELKGDREIFRKRNDLNTWDDMIFFDNSTLAEKRRLSSEGDICTPNHVHAKAIRKPLLELTIKGQRVRLEPLLALIKSLAASENVDSKTMAAMALQFVSSSSGDYSTSSFCLEIVSKGTFQGNIKTHISIAKSTFLLGQLEIGKRKYIELRRLCKSDNVLFPKYELISQYRADITLEKEFIFIRNVSDAPMGVGISYISIIKQTISRLLESLPTDSEFEFPLTFSAADGLDGSGSHQVYNQIQESPDIGSKNFILFAFKPLAIHDRANKLNWENERPNSQFQIRPVTLLAAKENSENVRHLMDTYINPYVADMEENGIPLSQGLVRIKLPRTMFDGKMAGILSGAGGAHCQLCTATFKQLHDVELIRDGFPINRSITSAKELFQSVNEVEFLSLSSNDRLGLTHQPISDIDIICSSPLHSYLCIFR
ncbi:hypothetical protein LOD99_8130 [Oopsacas minuta]|uniref:Uncharacterized protein n=1 Tax=Oopsacas minuta TaxID=111878 RepID=A0AAV7JI45_9METZ|nr:hypothetical protein LOD99_8130 [Oopsacas minuta]